MLNDFRHALRITRRSPAFTATIVVTLALGVGLTTAIFSVVQGVLLRSLDHPVRSGECTRLEC
jgi:putative ABC transport system permease protein